MCMCVCVCNLLCFDRGHDELLDPSGTFLGFSLQCGHRCKEEGVDQRGENELVQQQLEQADPSVAAGARPGKDSIQQLIPVVNDGAHDQSEKGKSNKTRDIERSFLLYRFLRNRVAGPGQNRRCDCLFFFFPSRN